MICHYTALHDLEEAIAAEAEQVSEFPVRFVLTEDLPGWREVLRVLKQQTETVLCLSALCTSADVLPDLHALRIRLDTVVGRRVLVLPLAERLRLDPNAPEGFLAELAEWRTAAGRGRIYVPLLALRALVEKELNRLLRYRNGILPPLFMLMGAGGVQVVAAPVPRTVAGFRPVEGLKAYFELWEQDGAERIALTSDLAPHLSPSRGVFEVRILRDAFDVVATACPNTQLDRDWGKPEQWTWLAQHIDDTGFIPCVSRLLNLRDPDPYRLMALWRNGSPEDRWLAWLWAKLALPRDSVLGQAIAHSRSTEDLMEQLFLIPLNLSADWTLEQASVRRRLLDAAEALVPPPIFWSRLEGAQAPLTRLQALAGLSKQEREEIIIVVGELLEQNAERGAWWPFLEISFPELAWYLAGFQCENDFVSKYFLCYTRARLKDAAATELAALAQKAAQTKALWAFPTRATALSGEIANGARVDWSDGLGVEWLGLVEGLLAHKPEIALTWIIARANLPSVTQENKGWEAGVKIHRTLDQLAHAYDYAFPSSFEIELMEVRKYVEVIIQGLNEGEAVVLTSDHGLSRAAFHSRTIPKPEGGIPAKWGRYVTFEKSRDSTLPAEDAWVQDGDGWYLAVHGRVSGGGGHSHGHVHGGATLEECLVPVLRFERVRASGPITVELMNNTLRLTPRGETELVVRLSARVARLQLRLSGQPHSGERREGNHWHFKLLGLKSGTYQGTLESESGGVNTIAFEIIGAITHDDLGL